MGTNQRIAADFGTVQNGRTHADQRTFANCAAMQNGSMSDRSKGTDAHRKAHICVQYAAILNIGAF